MTQRFDWQDPDLGMVRDDVVAHTPDGCEGCLALGTHWQHLMMCLTCGYVGCSDSSPMRHARHHAERTGHPVVQSLRHGDNWRWCFAHDVRICSPYPGTEMSATHPVARPEIVAENPGPGASVDRTPLAPLRKSS